MRGAIKGYERVAEVAAEVPATRLAYVGDRESDVLALLVRMTALVQISGVIEQ